MILHTINYTTLDISTQSLNLDDFKIIGKFKIVQSGSSGSILGHPTEGFSLPFLFENYDSFQIIHYPERYYFRVKDNAGSWTSWQRHKHKIADIDGLQTILDSFNNRIQGIQITLDSVNNTIQGIQATLDSFNNRITALENISIRLPPGVILLVAWNSNYYVGKRVLPLHGQGIRIADYPELVNATYVGDSVNNGAHFFYKYNSNTGYRSTSGDYFRLLDTKALVPRGRGNLGFGAVYFGGRVKYNYWTIGDLVEDTLENHTHWRLSDRSEEETLWRVYTNNFGHIPDIGYRMHVLVYQTGYMADGRINSYTRDSSFAVDFVITY